MKFSEIVDQAVEFLQRRARVSYRALQREFDLDDESLADLKAELIDAQRIATDEEGKVLVWVEPGINGETDKRINGNTKGEKGKGGNGETENDSGLRGRDGGRSAAERRQLTVLFCDLVGSTALSAQLDPEDLRAVVQQYQQTCAEVIQQHEGYIAQYLGDGLLVYFGYPMAHEDDARRAVRAGVEIIEALQQLSFRHQVPSSRQGEGQGEVRLQVRIGIHTGLVVIGEIGAGEKREMLALGETPNVAARIQGLAEPNTIFISAATQRLVEGQFECQPFGSHLLKGLDSPIAVYHVQSERQTDGQLAGRATLTPLVGREQEVGLLYDRWEQVKEGRGQVVLLSGEPGIGKSRLAYTLREQVTSEGLLLYEARCSPYHQHSALYPLIEVLQRTLLFTRQDTDSEKIEKLQRVLALYGMQEPFPLFTALLSLPTPAHYPALTLTPQKQKERTLQALLQMMMAQAERQATVSVWEDLHWADPSSLEFLTLLIEQIPTTKLLLVLTFRPEFTPLWKPRSHITQLMLNRLGKKQVEAMIVQAAAGHTLSDEVIEQIRLKTDGVPLFVEELTKSVIESGEARESGESPHRTPRELAIPATLQEALLARLDRLSEARQVAQLGATLGREFSYELLHAVAPISETDLQTALAKLIEAEILYQRGAGEHAQYFFKHALIQDTAYQSLLKSTRQQYHQQIAHVLEERFPDAKATRPELLAYHYTAAGLKEQALAYWQQAGERATQRSAYMEAISHLTKGLEVLMLLPDTLARVQQELTLQLALSMALLPTRGYAAPEVGKAGTRARELCQQLGETPQLFPVLFRLIEFYLSRGELQTLRELAEQLMRLAQNVQDPYPRSVAHLAVGAAACWLGELPAARLHVEQALALYDPQQHSHPTSNTADPRLEYLTFERAPWLNYRWASNTADPRIEFLAYAVWTLWPCGYPDQALKRSQEVLALAEELSQPLSLAYALGLTAWCHVLRREWSLAQERAEALMTLATEQGFPYWLGWAIPLRGGTLAAQGQVEEGILQIRQGIAAYRATGAEWFLTYFLALLAEAHRNAGQATEGLLVVAEALALVNKNGERYYEAELYRLRGELTLAQSSVQSLGSSVKKEAEECFLRAIEIAQRQQAKSLELRAVMSLARLWQQQALEQGAGSLEHGAGSAEQEARTKLGEAHKMLSEVYHWFTEGFDTKDLQEAKALLETLL